MIRRRKTRTVTVGNVKIGADYPVVVQSMVKKDTADIDAVVRQICELENAGCEVVRVAIRNSKAAKAIPAIKRGITIPLVADIHFDYRLAIEAIKGGADKIRINPGNIYRPDDIDKIIDAAASEKVPIRIGVNSGSVGRFSGSSGDPSDRMVDFAVKYLEHFRRQAFNDLIISLKGSDVPATVRAYRRIAVRCEYPLHLGVTAAGPPSEGIVKSSMGIGALLLDGIGDTIRVSLTGNPVKEVDIARRILSSAGLRHFGPEIVSCPTCGRCQVDLVSMVGELEEELKQESKRKEGIGQRPLTIAVMGCEVNGPGEAKIADIGVAFGKAKGVIFRRGKIVGTVNASDAVKKLAAMIAEEKCGVKESKSQKATDS